jgi:hypothetical protein
MKEKRTAYRAAVGKEGNCFLDLDVDGMTVLRRILTNITGLRDWPYQAQDRDRWQATVHTEMNLRV